MSGKVISTDTGADIGRAGLPLVFSLNDSVVADSGHLRECSLKNFQTDKAGLIRLTERRPLVGHTDKVTFLHFSVDGQRLFTGCDDGVVRLWNTENAELMLKRERSGKCILQSSLSWRICFLELGA